MGRADNLATHYPNVNQDFLKSLLPNPSTFAFGFPSDSFRTGQLVSSGTPHYILSFQRQPSFSTYLTGPLEAASQFNFNRNHSESSESSTYFLPHKRQQKALNFLSSNRDSKVSGIELPRCRETTFGHARKHLNACPRNVNEKPRFSLFGTGVSFVPSGAESPLD